MFNKNENDILYSLILGDGYISKIKDRDSYAITITHGECQKDYCEWKMNLLNSLNKFKNSILHYKLVFDQKTGKKYG